MDCNVICNIMCKHLNTIGLAFNFIGTLLVVFHIGKDQKEWAEGEKGQKPGEKWYSVYIKHPNWLIFGTILIIIGFALSFFDSLLK